MKLGVLAGGVAFSESVALGEVKGLHLVLDQMF